MKATECGGTSALIIFDRSESAAVESIGAEASSIVAFCFGKSVIAKVDLYEVFATHIQRNLDNDPTNSKPTNHVDPSPLTFLCIIHKKNPSCHFMTTLDARLVHCESSHICAGRSCAGGQERAVKSKVHAM